MPPGWPGGCARPCRRRRAGRAQPRTAGARERPRACVNRCSWHLRPSQRTRGGERPDGGDERPVYGREPMREVAFHASMHDRAPGIQSTPTGPAPVSVHFVNNVLAAAASYIEVEPDTARDVLAGLGAFLSHRLRPGRIVPLAQELDHVAVYVRLEQARFPGRLEAELPPAGGVPAIDCVPGEVQAPLADALGRWLGARRGRVRPAPRARLDRAGAA